jgi:hypothetical protein
MIKSSSIDGFLKKPKHNAKGRTYKGRFTCPDVQWTGEEMATFTITAEELAAAAANNLLWTDQDVQRGIQPGVSPVPPRELSLANGYPDPAKYVFDTDKANDITEKLLAGQKIYLNPLVWNLRPKSFEAYWDEKDEDLYIYDGRIYLPDSHHRHQAIIQAVNYWRQAHKDYPKFSDEKEFKVELYFLTREDEGNFFYDKNLLPKPTAKSKAYDLTTEDDLSLLAKRMIERSKNLQGNVNRVTDRLVAKNPQVVTLSTLREMMKTVAASDLLDHAELDGLANIASQFYDLLVEVRPELGHLSIPDRNAVRSLLLVDSAVMMHGYAALMKDYKDDLPKIGTSKARTEWAKKLQSLSSSHQYKFGSWGGDFFAKNNPLWRDVGIVKPGRDPTKLTVVNTGAARLECGRVLRQLLSVELTTKNIQFLAKT